MTKILRVFHSRYVDDDDGDVYGDLGEDGDTETTWKLLFQCFCISHTILTTYLTSYTQKPIVTPSLPTQGQSCSQEKLSRQVPSASKVNSSSAYGESYRLHRITF